MGPKITQVENADSLACIKLGSNGYGNKIQDISTSRGWARRKGDFSTFEAQFALRSELWKLMRIARIATPGALHGASAASRTFDDVASVLENQSVSEQVDSANFVEAE